MRCWRRARRPGPADVVSTGPGRRTQVGEPANTLENAVAHRPGLILKKEAEVGVGRAPNKASTTSWASRRRIYGPWTSHRSSWTGERRRWTLRGSQLTGTSRWREGRRGRRAEEGRVEHVQWIERLDLETGHASWCAWWRRRTWSVKTTPGPQLERGALRISPLHPLAPRPLLSSLVVSRPGHICAFTVLARFVALAVNPSSHVRCPRGAYEGEHLPVGHAMCRRAARAAALATWTTKARSGCASMCGTRRAALVEVYTFVCAHLIAHAHKTASRLQDYHHIVGYSSSPRSPDSHRSRRDRTRRLPLDLPAVTPRHWTGSRQSSSGRFMCIWEDECRNVVQLHALRRPSRHPIASARIRAPLHLVFVNFIKTQLSQILNGLQTNKLQDVHGGGRVPVHRHPREYRARPLHAAVLEWFNRVSERQARGGLYSEDEYVERTGLVIGYDKTDVAAASSCRSIAQHPSPPPSPSASTRKVLALNALIQLCRTSSSGGGCGARRIAVPWTERLVLRDWYRHVSEPGQRTGDGVGRLLRTGEKQGAVRYPPNHCDTEIGMTGDDDGSVKDRLRPRRGTGGSLMAGHGIWLQHLDVFLPCSRPCFAAASKEAVETSFLYGLSDSIREWRLRLGPVGWYLNEGNPSAGESGGLESPSSQRRGIFWTYPYSQDIAQRLFSANACGSSSGAGSQSDATHDALGRGLTAGAPGRTPGLALAEIADHGVSRRTGTARNQPM
ncbi:hypothetical protein C8Q80DRAFT_1124144 [Daedaleopsis nitida]|nr:hypothetical protein C8Q80DRAFT_1124144 [Daedaleopsis nitida]